MKYRNIRLLQFSILPRSFIDLNKEPILLLAESDAELLEIEEDIQKNYDKLNHYNIVLIQDRKIFDIFDDKIDNDKISEIFNELVKETVTMDIAKALPFLFLLLVRCLSQNGKISQRQYFEDVTLYFKNISNRKPTKELYERLKENIKLL